ncbi:hypothetical protein GCK32_021417 [Trichostrongylus colubriformis]|uniref:Uncharacterized protein n=1 Tax=Trichostrongylus colubriformis TaxID=6319 RepID=A0AAN8IG28_TRICO
MLCKGNFKTPLVCDHTFDCSAMKHTNDFDCALLQEHRDGIASLVLKRQKRQEEIHKFCSRKGGDGRSKSTSGTSQETNTLSGGRRHSNIDGPPPTFCKLNKS